MVVTHCLNALKLWMHIECNMDTHEANDPAGSMSGILAALTAAIAFTAIKFVPKSEPTVVLAMWFHCSALATAVVPLAVRLLGMPLCVGEVTMTKKQKNGSPQADI